MENFGINVNMTLNDGKVMRGRKPTDKAVGAVEVSEHTISARQYLTFGPRCEIQCYSLLIPTWAWIDQSGDQRINK